MSLNYVENYLEEDLSDASRNLITSGSENANGFYSPFVGVSKYVIEKKPEIFDIRINFQMNYLQRCQFGLIDVSDNYLSGTYTNPAPNPEPYLLFQVDNYIFPDDDPSWSNGISPDNIQYFGTRENYGDLPDESWGPTDGVHFTITNEGGVICL